MTLLAADIKGGTKIVHAGTGRSKLMKYDLDIPLDICRITSSPCFILPCLPRSLTSPSLATFRTILSDAVENQLYTLHHSFMTTWL